jgi:predicted transcriptional regulator
MTLTLELPPDVEERLRANAALFGRDVAGYLLMLAEGDASTDPAGVEDTADFEASVAELREGFADLEAGRTIPFEEVAARGRIEREERRRRRAAVTPAGAPAEAAA